MLYTLESNSLFDMHASYQDIREEYYCTLYVMGNMYNFASRLPKAHSTCLRKDNRRLNGLASSQLHRQCSLADKILDAVPTCKALEPNAFKQDRKLLIQRPSMISHVNAAHTTRLPRRNQSKSGICTTTALEIKRSWLVKSLPSRRVHHPHHRHW